MNAPQQKVLVTGAAGYIGSILVPELLRRGHAVTAIDNFMYSQSSLLDCCNHDSLQIVRGDVRDEALIKEHLRTADIIIPLACLVGAPLCKQKPIEARCRGEAEIAAEVRRVVRHEVAHHFGIDDARLRQIESGED